ncbi:hypothetical protein GN330_20050 [Nitratireductor sp. CAU 1489]|uniref:DUF7282 domain-containing protein n=2 Tax=Nitratireductor arenosus TaxID=2682096 RepID=A0A844QI01_9HYPH|nr:hypothetical protein [Nitratireductor arenosus]
MRRFPTAALTFALSGSAALAMSNDAVMVTDQDVSSGVVTAEKITAEANGWLVVHRTDTQMKPGPVIGYAPLKAGDNMDVSAILQTEVKSGEMLMLMVHGEAGGMKTGVFEYTLGAKEDGPVRVDDKLVMTVISAK